MSMNTLLMGLRGCGKSTIGRRLAELQRRPFIELDERVLATFAASSVHAAWAVHGEDAWRDAEVRMLTKTLDADDQVVALGGGTPIIPAARQRIAAQQRAGRAKVIYLRCATDELVRRLAHDPGDRPSLTQGDPAQETAAVLAQREPTYRELADLEYDVTDTAPEEAAKGLIELAFRE